MAKVGGEITVTVVDMTDRGNLASLPLGESIAAPVPFVYVVRADGQEIRLEAPTVEGLILLVNAVHGSEGE